MGLKAALWPNLGIRGINLPQYLSIYVISNTFFYKGSSSETQPSLNTFPTLRNPEKDKLVEEQTAAWLGRLREQRVCGMAGGCVLRQKEGECEGGLGSLRAIVKNPRTPGFQITALRKTLQEIMCYKQSAK